MEGQDHLTYGVWRFTEGSGRQGRWKDIVATSSVVPRRPPGLRDWEMRDSLPFLYSISRPTTFLLYHARSYPIYHSPSLCIPSIRSQDIEQKRSRNHGLPENSIPSYIVCGGIIRLKRPTAEIALFALEALFWWNFAWSLILIKSSHRDCLSSYGVVTSGEAFKTSGVGVVYFSVS